MATAPVRVSPWVAEALAKPVDRDDLVHQLAEALEDEILAHPEVRQAEAKLKAGLDRFASVNESLANELNLDDLIQIDYYCATVRATLTAVLKRSEGVAS